MFKDQRVIWQLKRGNRAVLSQIYEMYRDDLLRLALAMLGRRQAAEDVVHDVFLQFIRSIRQFRLTGSIRGYLATCVANRARNVSKADRRVLEYRKQTVPCEASATRGPEDWILCTEAFLQINQALAQLPFDQREVVTLHIYGKMTFREIAASQAISIKTVQSRYRYGLAKLKGLLVKEVDL